VTPHRSNARKKILIAAAVPTLALLWAMARPEKPAVVACVDLERVYAGLDQHKAGEGRLDELLKGEAVKRDKLVADTQSIQAELENFNNDSPVYNETARKLRDAADRLRVFEDFLKRKLEFERANLVRSTYAAVKAALSDYCKAQNIDIVFMDDATPPFDKNDPRPITQQISGRRMLWFNPALDVTDDLIKSMNASFAAGKK
jgi:Skp family chaperone for outer membrane proteins